MIPKFPSFKKLEVSDKGAIESVTKDFEPYSDHNFVSLFCWDTDESILVSKLNENLILFFVDYITNETYYTLIGKNAIDETIQAVIGYARDSGADPTLRLVPEPVVRLIKNPEIYEINEDRDSFDYILSVDDLVELKGTKFHPQRNFINRYRQAYEHDTKMKTLTLSDAKTKEEVLNLFYKWESSRNKDRKETERELNAIKKLLDHAHLLDIKAIGLFINNELKGFSINEIISDSHGVAHFEKVDVSHVGIFQFLKHESALMFKESGTKYMNIEQDLGIEGLRKTKLANQPVYFLKKYTISLKD